MMQISLTAYEGIWRAAELPAGVSLVVMCGFDGSGKTTQADLLKNVLTQAGREVVRTKQPTNWYRNEPSLRAYIDSGAAVDQLYLALLAATDRRKHVVEVIDPAISAGADVISDRYVYSSLAYFAARGLDPNVVASLNRDIPRPRLTVLLDVPSAVLFERIKMRDKGRHKHEERSVSVIEQVRANFLRIAEIDRDILVVDGDQPTDTVHARVCEELARRLS
jgi:dTMP kinase